MKIKETNIQYTKSRTLPSGETETLNIVTNDEQELKRLMSLAGFSDSCSCDGNCGDECQCDDTCDCKHTNNEEDMFVNNKKPLMEPELEEQNQAEYDYGHDRETSYRDDINAYNWRGRGGSDNSFNRVNNYGDNPMRNHMYGDLKESIGSLLENNTDGLMTALDKMKNKKYDSFSNEEISHLAASFINLMKESDESKLITIHRKFKEYLGDDLIGQYKKFTESYREEDFDIPHDDDDEYEYEEDVESECPMCEEPNQPMGTLGQKHHYRCRSCGIEYNVDVNNVR